MRDEAGGDEDCETPRKDEEQENQTTKVVVNDHFSHQNMFSGAEKAPRLGTLEEYTHQMNEPQSILSVHEQNIERDNAAPKNSDV